MTLDQFRYFLETSKFQHVGKAAKALHISPSAISTAISNLEEELGSKLFERKGQGIQLTEKGRKFRSQIEVILDQVGELCPSLSEKIEQLTGNYRLAASHFLSSKYLGQAWSKIQANHPQLSVELNAMSTARVITEILSGSLDAGLCFSPLRHPDLKHVQLLEGQLRLVVRKGHPLLKKSTREQLTLLSQYPAVIHKATPGVDLCEDHPMFGKFGIVPKTKCLWDSDDLAVEVMKKTDSWSLMPDIVCHTYQASIETLKIPQGWDAPYSVALVLRSHRAENPFLKLLGQELAMLVGKGLVTPKNRKK